MTKKKDMVGFLLSRFMGKVAGMTEEEGMTWVEMLNRITERTRVRRNESLIHILQPGFQKIHPQKNLPQKIETGYCQGRNE